MQGQSVLSAACSIAIPTTARLPSGRGVTPEGSLPISLFIPTPDLDALQQLARTLRRGHVALLRAALGRERAVDAESAARVLWDLCREELGGSPRLTELFAPQVDPPRIVPRRPLQEERVQLALNELRVHADRCPAPGTPPMILDLRDAPLASFGRALGWLAHGIHESELHARLALEPPEIALACEALQRAGLVTDRRDPTLELQPGEIAHLGHATLLANLGGEHVLIDPWLPPASRDDRVAPLAVSGLPKIAAVLISHHHFDHLHIETLLRLDKAIPIYVPAQPADAPLVAKSDLLLRHLGFADVRELVPGVTLDFGARGGITAVPFYGEDPTRIGYSGLCYVLHHQDRAALVHVDSSADHEGRSLISTGGAADLVRRFGPLSPLFATRRQERGLMIDYPWEFLLQPAPLWLRPADNCCNDARFLTELTRACAAKELVLYSEGGADFYPESTDFLRRPSTPARMAPHEYLWDPLDEIRAAVQDAGAALRLSDPRDVFRIGG